MIRKFREFISLRIAKNPGKAVLEFILFFNVLFFLFSAFVIYRLAPESLAGCGFWQTTFYTITMVLDAGCISFIVNDATTTSGIVIVVCLLVVLIGMVIFTGAVIGYLTNYISSFIDKSNEGSRSLLLSDHTIILNWNSRGSEIINDLLYSEKKEKVVILVTQNKEQIEKEIAERIADTIQRENAELEEALKEKKIFERMRFIGEKRMTNRTTVLVREGDTYSTKQLMDISIDRAKAVIILGKDSAMEGGGTGAGLQPEHLEEGNTDLIKTLVQVVELTGAVTSADNQHIVVEVEDDWTLSIVERIIEHKEQEGKCSIIPVAVNRVLGQILSQFSVMPELNLVYRTLFSNKGAAFYCERMDRPADINAFFREYMEYHADAIPLGFLDTKEGTQCFFMSSREQGIHDFVSQKSETAPLQLKPKFRMGKKHVVIIGHNSKSHYIMEGFNSFRDEWNEKEDGVVMDEIMDIMVIDDPESLKKQNYYREYPQVTSYKEATIYERDKIVAAINSFIKTATEDTSILILSDDQAPTEELDGNALIYLIYVEEIIQKKLEENPNFDKGSIDVIVEILNPKNSDVARSYSADNVVISNRYVSKMMTQISEKQTLFEFYNDILTYDTADAGEETGYGSYEIYTKKVSAFFDEIPAACTAAELIRGVFEAGPEDNKSLVLGYVKPDGTMVLFDKEQYRIPVALNALDKLIVYSNH